jgi:D-glycero-D-manno-heptose 1,7-bisphosphate phosphatase
MSEEYSAYFFDLGGTLVAIEHDEIACSASGDVTLLAGVKETLMGLRGKRIFVITNQAGVALGQLSEEKARGFIEQVDKQVGQTITDYSICMHHPAAECACRKPQPGMVLDLAQEYAVDLSQAVLIGDATTDEQCAHRAGIGTFLWADTFFGREGFTTSSV